MPRSTRSPTLTGVGSRPGTPAASLMESRTNSPIDGPAVPPTALAVDAPAFGTRPDISARSVLVTIFGDSVVPAGGEIWLGDLIELCALFGFNDRLIRTSVFRLGAEGWFEVERVGRRSRYRLTPWALEEFTAAETRIYGPLARPWDGRWTLVMLDPDAPDRATAEVVREILEADGFAPLAAGVLARPRVEPGRVADLARRAGISGPLVTATAEFDDLAPLATTGWAARSFGLAPVAARYQEVVARYGPVAAGTTAGAAGRPTGADAFALRTMVVHEWRRARLADPDLPPALLPLDWPAAEARAVAAALYHHAATAAETWLATATGLHTDPTAVATRFA